MAKPRTERSSFGSRADHKPQRGRQEKQPRKMLKAKENPFSWCYMYSSIKPSRSCSAIRESP